MKITDKHVFFYVEWPSNFAKTKFTWTAFGETNEFFCTEQAFMWAKAKYFNDEEIATKLLTEHNNDPMKCKKFGRLVKNYDDRMWNLVRYSYMLDVNLCKYQQDEKMKAKLLDPKFDGKTFVEASPTDCIWGIGLGEGNANIDDETKWQGRNLLGQAITQCRDIIMKDCNESTKFNNIDENPVDISTVLQTLEIYLMLLSNQKQNGAAEMLELVRNTIKRIDHENN